MLLGDVITQVAYLITDTDCNYVLVPLDTSQHSSSGFHVNLCNIPFVLNKDLSHSVLCRLYVL